MATLHSKKTPTASGAGGVTMDHCAAAAHYGWYNTKSPVVHRPSNGDFSMAAANLVLSRSTTASMSAPVSASASAAASASALAAIPRSSLPKQTGQRSPGRLPVSQRQSTVSTQNPPVPVDKLDKDAWSMAAARGALEQSFIKPKANKQQDQQHNTQLLSQALPLKLKQPLQQRRYSMQPPTRAPSGQALSAATVAHAPYLDNAQRRASAPPLYATRPRSMYSASTLTNGNLNLGASGYDRSRQEEIHATALAMAQQMFAQQQAGSSKGKQKANMASAGATHDPLHEKAWKLAQARLAQMDDGSLVVRDSQSYYIAEDRTSSRKFSRLGRRHNRRDDGSSGADGDDSDAEDSDFKAHADDQPRSIFARRLSSMQIRKRQSERDALLAAARRNVENTMAEIDEETMATTGRLHPRHVTAWEAKAREAAAHRKAKRDRADEDGPDTPVSSWAGPSDKYNVGGGVTVDKTEVEALANQNLEPLFTDIRESAAIEKERKEQQRIEQETKKQEESADKARKGKLNEIVSIFNSQKKREKKEEKKQAKLAAKEAKRKDKERTKGSQKHSKLKDSISAPVPIPGLEIPAMGASTQHLATTAGEPSATSKPATNTVAPVDSTAVTTGSPTVNPAIDTVAPADPTAATAASSTVSPAELALPESPIGHSALGISSPASEAVPAFISTPTYPDEPVPTIPDKSADRNLPTSSETAVMSATVSPEELHDFPASSPTGLSPIDESSTPTPDTTVIAAVPFTDGSPDASTHATTIENNAASQVQHETEPAEASNKHEPVVPMAVLAGAGVDAATSTALESSHQTAADALGSPLHPLQSNPPMIEAKKRINDNINVDSAYDPNYDQGAQQQEKEQENSSSTQKPQKTPASMPTVTASSVDGGLSNSAPAQDPTTPKAEHKAKGVPSSELSRDERREASLERARQTQLNAASVLPEQQKRISRADHADEEYQIPLESETSSADRVRNWFRTYVRSRKDISQVGGLDNSDMLVAGADPVPHTHAQTGVASTLSPGYPSANGADTVVGNRTEGIDGAERSIKQKKRSSFFNKLAPSLSTKDAKVDEKREFVHEPNLARGKSNGITGGGLDVPPLPKHLKQDRASPVATDERASRFKEVMP
ncbi:Eisosome assembly protein [Ceratocystis pirilliformis]|uniref:Eisosome assembly protein n=1 Tax=Ceratocystis pirilliformis TaxID=259994 RepID=A0ABR3ZIL6_9PEZI